MSSGALISRRSALAALGLAALAVPVAACGPPSEPPPGGALRVVGAFGPTELAAPPRRVVALGLGPDADTLTALGVPPIAVSRNASVPTGVAPWATDPGAPPPVLLGTGSGTPFEEIAAQTPDLIVATTQYSLPVDHARLAQIAPVLAYAHGPNTDRWQDTTRRVGTVLGRSELAGRLVADTEARIAAARNAHPVLTGRTFTFGPVTGDGVVSTTRSPEDLSATFLSQLGLVLSPRVRALPAGSTPGKARLSPERLDLLDADLLLLTYATSDPAARARIENGPLFSALPAVRRGSYLAIDLPTALAMAFPSALSLNYALGRVVEPLAAAVHPAR